MIKKYFLFLLLFMIHLNYLGFSKTPKREFRAVWVATVGNIDWPSQKGLDAETQKQEFIRLLNIVERNNMNAVIVQIRPAADALYQSSFEDWSRYLSGKQGVPPSPYYDPLAFMIEECHRRCIEFHAWFNPYRALVEANKNPNSTQHVTNQHPDWFVNYGGKKYFDPGIPEVSDYFTKIVLDVVKRYDIDAVHFDDYFYPYRIANVEFPDYNSYAKYGKSFANKDDWRRDNVNRLIEKISMAIKKEKNYIKFGISPFGVWRNQRKDLEGSNTNGGQTNYDDLYADVILWQKKGWIDYLLPQLYWEIGHRSVDYITLLDWWGHHAYGRNMYIGHGVYRLASDSKLCWKSLTEMDNQIEILRKNKNIEGSAFYSAKTLLNNTYNINEKMRNEWYKTPALLPSMNWLPSENIPVPVVKITKKTGASNRIEWEIDDRKNRDFQFVVYRFLSTEKADISSSENILKITRSRDFFDNNIQDKKYKYVVTTLDRLHNESHASNIVE